MGRELLRSPVKTFGLILAALLVILAIAVLIYRPTSTQEPYGYWKPDKAAEQTMIQQLRAELPEDKWQLTIDNSAGVRKAEICNLEKSANISNLTYEEKTQIVYDFVSKYSAFFGTDSITIKKVEWPYEMIFEPQTYKGVQLCGGYAGSASFLTSLSCVKVIWYQNLTMETEPAIPKEEFISSNGIEDGNSVRLCTLPKWYAEGEYWKYFLVWEYDYKHYSAFSGKLIE